MRTNRSLPTPLRGGGGGGGETQTSATRRCGSVLPDAAPQRRPHDPSDPVATSAHAINLMSLWFIPTPGPTQQGGGELSYPRQLVRGPSNVKKSVRSLTHDSTSVGDGNARQRRAGAMLTI